MEHQTAAAPARMHPLVMGAGASVILVSLLGAAAITGVIPSSHGSAVSTAAPAAQPIVSGVATAAIAANTRYVTSDGQVLEAVPSSPKVAPVRHAAVTQVEHVYQPAPVVHRKVVHHYAQNSYAQSAQPSRAYEQTQPTPVYQQPQPAYLPQQHPIQNYVSDMHPVGTGVGAVVGGLLGNQVGGGNGKKLATVAGVLLGGYAGNEVAHNRNPVPW
ncbi:MAG: 17 kDa surface antigen [Herminiimonas sp.]|nr:17 kDa surface antigen [Herminiimonas sp.]